MPTTIILVSVVAALAVVLTVSVLVLQKKKREISALSTKLWSADMRYDLPEEDFEWRRWLGKRFEIYENKCESSESDASSVQYSENGIDYKAFLVEFWTVSSPRGYNRPEVGCRNQGLFVLAEKDGKTWLLRFLLNPNILCSSFGHRQPNLSFVKKEGRLYIAHEDRLFDDGSEYHREIVNKWLLPIPVVRA